MIYIDENLLCENIPADLAKAYKKLAKQTAPSASQRNPKSNHAEISNNKTRRFTRYDYGKATYEEISKDDAVRLVKENPHNIESLRILYNGNLIEFEIRDNGSPYCIYGDRSERFIADDGKEYKNIAFAPWRKVISSADKIYKTDEYDYLITDDTDIGKRRKANSEIYPIGSQSPMTPDTRLTPGSRYYTDPRIMMRNPDTGAHRYEASYEPNTALDDQQAYQAVASRFQAKLNRYYTWQEQKRTVKKKIKVLINTLKKLEKEKDEYTEEEYDELHKKYTESLQQSKKEYEELIAEQTKFQKEVIGYFNQDILELNKKLGKYFLKLDRLLADADDQRQRCEKLLRNPAGEVEYYDISRIRDRKKQISNLIDRINQTKNLVNLEEITPLEGASRTGELEKQIEDLVAALVNYRSEKFESATKAINNYEKRLAELQLELDEIQAEFLPKKQAKKAMQAARDAAELDPRLANIIVFDDEEDTEK